MSAAWFRDSVPTNPTIRDPDATFATNAQPLVN